LFEDRHAIAGPIGADVHQGTSAGPNSVEIDTGTTGPTLIRAVQDQLG
jgi:hypothetical protein